MSKNRKVDWGAVEKDYRAGKLSNRQIAEKHSIAESYVRKKAAERGWEKGKPIRPPPVSALPKPGPRPEPLGAVISGDVIAPNDTVGLAEDILRRQLNELDAITAHIGEIEAAIEAETSGDQNGRRRDAMMKAVSLPARANVLKTLMQAKDLIDGGAAGKIGKKEQAKADAQEAVSTGGRLAPRRPPTLVVDNQ